MARQIEPDALVNLTIYYYALPQFKGIKRYKETLMMFWFKIALGLWFFAGVLMTVWHLFTLRPEQEKA